MASDILKRASLIQREIFDPKNKAHVESLKEYLRTGNWGDVQFYPELPYVEVPVSVMRKYLAHTLKITPETPQELADRLATKNLVKQSPPEDRKIVMERGNELLTRQLQAM